MNKLLVRSVVLLGIATVVHIVMLGGINHGQESPSRPTTSLSIDAIFHNKGFVRETFVGQWQSDSQGFERIGRDADTGHSSIVRIDLVDPTQEHVLVDSTDLIPAGSSKLLTIDSYQ